MGLDFECGCRLSGSLFMCSKHETKFIGSLIEEDEQDLDLQE